jgi:hypothetical protein
MKRQSGLNDANVSVIRGEHEMYTDSEDCQKKLVKKIQIVTLIACAVQGSIQQTDAAKSRSYAQNGTRVAMKSVQVQTTEKHFFVFSTTLNKYSARLP